MEGEDFSQAQGRVLNPMLNNVNYLPLLFSVWNDKLTGEWGSRVLLNHVVLNHVVLNRLFYCHH